MVTEVLREGVLNDDLLHLAEDGKVFKGGYIAIIEYYTFLNEWGNQKNFRRFRTQKSLDKYLSNKY